MNKKERKSDKTVNHAVLKSGMQKPGGNLQNLRRSQTVLKLYRTVPRPAQQSLRLQAAACLLRCTGPPIQNFYLGARQLPDERF